MKRVERMQFLSQLIKFAGPKWVANEKIWNRAEKIMKKYKRRYGEGWYGAVVDLYFNLGGKKKAK